MNCAQTAYALARALVELRLAELRAALEKHERERRWNGHEQLVRIERGLAAFAEEVEKR